MNNLDRFLTYCESHRIAVCAISSVLTISIAWADALTPDLSLGFLYLFPILIAAPALRGWQILAIAGLFGCLREVFEPHLNSVVAACERFSFTTAGYVVTGLLVSTLNDRRRNLNDYLAERERQTRLREDTEQQMRNVIETSPLAILTLNHAGRIALSNESANKLFGFQDGSLPGTDAAPYLPILCRTLQASHWVANIRTAMECKAQRRNGEVFLAHVWFSTYNTNQGPGMAVVVWDASEDLRDREASGLDATIAASRVLIAAMSHEIHNLAAAAASVHNRLASQFSIQENNQYQLLGSLIEGLKKIAASDLRNAPDHDVPAADLSTLLYEARMIIEPGLREAGISLIWDVSETLPMVQADHHSLLQVFVNLARNSMKALEVCAIRQVEVSVGVEHSLVTIFFRDSGPGVAEPSELFRPFQAGAQGVGLGLYISRALLLAHGGGLHYQAEGSGSCFVVELMPVEIPGPN